MRTIVTVLSVLIYLVPLHSLADDTSKHFVLQILTDKCRNVPYARTGTGFMIRGLEGIVTALHTVAGCEEISASYGSSSEENPYHSLEIVKVDLLRDIAVLSGDDPRLQAKRGFEPAAQEKQYKELTVLGFPMGLQEVYDSKPFPVTEVSLKKLDALIPLRLKQPMKDRDSPSPDIQVLNIKGQLLHGHSGAPVINEEGLLIGVANGGLGVGTDISWAVSWRSVQLKPAHTVREQVLRLSKLPPDLVFAFPKDSFSPEGMVPIGDKGVAEEIDLDKVVLKYNSQDQLVEAVLTKECYNDRCAPLKENWLEEDYTIVKMDKGRSEIPATMEVEDTGGVLYEIYVPDVTLYLPNAFRRAVITQFFLKNRLKMNIVMPGATSHFMEIVAMRPNWALKRPSP